MLRQALLCSAMAHAHSPKAIILFKSWNADRDELVLIFWFKFVGIGWAAVISQIKIIGAPAGVLGGGNTPPWIIKWLWKKSNWTPVFLLSDILLCILEPDRDLIGLLCNSKLSRTILLTFRIENSQFGPLLSLGAIKPSQVMQTPPSIEQIITSVWISQWTLMQQACWEKPCTMSCDVLQSECYARLMERQ